MLISTFLRNGYRCGGYLQSYALGYTGDINVVIHEVINSNKEYNYFLSFNVASIRATISSGVMFCKHA